MAVQEQYYGLCEAHDPKTVQCACYGCPKSLIRTKPYETFLVKRHFATHHVNVLDASKRYFDDEDRSIAADIALLAPHMDNLDVVRQIDGACFDVHDTHRIGVRSVLESVLDRVRTASTSVATVSKHLPDIAFGLVVSTDYAHERAVMLLQTMRDDAQLCCTLTDGGRIYSLESRSAAAPPSLSAATAADPTTTTD